MRKTKLPQGLTLEDLLLAMERLDAHQAPKARCPKCKQLIYIIRLASGNKEKTLCLGCSQVFDTKNLLHEQELMQTLAPLAIDIPQEVREAMERVCDSMQGNPVWGNAQPIKDELGHES